MDNLTNLKAIWHTAKTDDLPTSAQMLQLIQKFRSQRLKKKWTVIIVASLLTLLMIFTIIYYQPEMITTRIGQLFITIGCAWLAFTNIKSIRRFYQLEDCSNAEFLAFIEQTRQNQIYFYKKTQVIIMLLSSVGLLLYFYESASKSPRGLIITYSLSALYLAISWLVVRPRTFRKNAEKLNAVRAHLNKISQQLKDDEV
jgi:4-amino-4-deoxy-L-arabinose transferase-like glycosyltransferase